MKSRASHIPVARTCRKEMAARSTAFILFHGPPVWAWGWGMELCTFRAGPPHSVNPFVKMHSEMCFIIALGALPASFLPVHLAVSGSLRTSYRHDDALPPRTVHRPHRTTSQNKPFPLRCPVRYCGRTISLRRLSHGAKAQDRPVLLYAGLLA